MCTLTSPSFRRGSVAAFLDAAVWFTCACAQRKYLLVSVLLLAIFASVPQNLAITPPKLAWRMHYHQGCMPILNKLDMTQFVTTSKQKVQFINIFTVHNHRHIPLDNLCVLSFPLCSHRTIVLAGFLSWEKKKVHARHLVEMDIASSSELIAVLRAPDSTGCTYNKSVQLFPENVADNFFAGLTKSLLRGSHNVWTLHDKGDPSRKKSWLPSASVLHTIQQVLLLIWKATYPAK